ncbi:DUF2889 domain-containing protein [Niveibacterium sp. SC-1]|uniref:DUF2889 domain-containing protein n=1 Tax=Niveibacterium sp. SC-1 TaxID=3135646 RepID=UPI00311EB268
MSASDQELSATVDDSAAVARRPLHLRRIDLQGFARDDGLFEIEAALLDTKAIDYPILSGTRRAGEPVHRMRIRLVFDRRFAVHGLQALTEASPYPGACEQIAPDYSVLVGCNLFDGFRRVVTERFGGTAGCAHLTELLFALPTAALQTLATLVREDEGEAQPYQLDRCHALALDGAVVRSYYPRWYRVAAKD